MSDEKLTDHELALCERSAKQAVEKTFAILGVDINIPRDVEDFRQDLRFSGRLRKAMDKGIIAFVVAVIGVMVAGMAAAMSGYFRGPQ